MTTPSGFRQAGISGRLTAAAAMVAATAALSGCTMMGYPGFGASASSADPQITPSSTTVNTGQTMAFQVSGGTPPYHFQISGVGTLDSAGNYQAGATPGQSQIQVADANGAMSSASVTVAQTGYGTYSAPPTDYGTGYDERSRAGTGPARTAVTGWTPATLADLQAHPLVEGQVVAAADRPINAQGDHVRSQFVRTDLRHPLVRLDKLIEGKEIVAVHAVVEDQFVVSLRPGHTAADLRALLAQSAAHISRHGPPAGVFLVSMNSEGPANSAAGPTVSADFLARRAALKQRLQAIAVVTPNFLMRTPAGGAASF